MEKLRHILPVILAIGLFYLKAPVAAHEFTQEPWLLINSKPALRNLSTPAPAALPAAEKYVDLELSAGSAAVFGVRTAVIEREKFIPSGNLGVSWSLDSMVLSTEPRFEFSPGRTGSFLLNVVLTDLRYEMVVYSETIRVNFGSAPLPGGIIVAGRTSSPMTVAVGEEVNISAASADPAKFLYQWDFGDGTTAEGPQATHTFYASTLPSALVLRVTDRSNGVFSDSYVLIEAAGGVTVPRPPNETGTIEKEDSESAKVQPWGTIAVVLLILTGMLLVGRSGRK